METIGQSSDEAELRLLTEWEEPGDRARTTRAGVLSFLVHVAVILVLLWLPDSITEPVRQAVLPHRVTPLIEPLTEPTQTTPNKGKISKEFNAQEVQPRPRIQIPPSPPSTTRPAAPQQAAVPPAPPPRAAPAPALPEPPKIEAAVKETQKLTAEPTQIAQVTPPPQIQPQETKPKLAFETPGEHGPGQGGGLTRVTPPDASVAEAVRNAARGGSAGGTVVGDQGLGIGGIGEGLNLPPSPGRQGSNLELLSDPMGVDFRPYLVQILAAVRRNWWAVMPASAKMGRRGKVGIQFSIARNGNVPKLVIVLHSGTDAFDRAAVAGVSASNPFPPLPTEFKGDQIRLQFNFSYNMPN